MTAQSTPVIQGLAMAPGTLPFESSLKHSRAGTHYNGIEWFMTPWQK